MALHHSYKHLRPPNMFAVLKDGKGLVGLYDEDVDVLQRLLLAGDSHMELSFVALTLGWLAER